MPVPAGHHQQAAHPFICRVNNEDAHQPEAASHPIGAQAQHQYEGSQTGHHRVDRVTGSPQRADDDQVEHTPGFQGHSDPQQGLRGMYHLRVFGEHAHQPRRGQCRGQRHAARGEQTVAHGLAHQRMRLLEVPPANQAADHDLAGPADGQTDQQHIFQQLQRVGVGGQRSNAQPCGGSQ